MADILVIDSGTASELVFTNYPMIFDSASTAEQVLRAMTLRVAEIRKSATIAELDIPKGQPSLQFTGGKLTQVKVEGIVHPNHPFYKNLDLLKQIFENEDYVIIDTGYQTLTNFKISTLIWEEVGGTPLERSFSLILTRVS